MSLAFCIRPCPERHSTKVPSTSVLGRALTRLTSPSEVRDAAPRRAQASSRVFVMCPPSSSPPCNASRRRKPANGYLSLRSSSRFEPTRAARNACGESDPIESRLRGPPCVHDSVVLADLKTRDGAGRLRWRHRKFWMAISIATIDRIGGLRRPVHFLLDWMRVWMGRGGPMRPAAGQGGLTLAAER